MVYCRYCDDKYFATQEGYERHLETSLAHQTTVCRRCERSFPHVDAFKAHCNAKHAPAQAACEKCKRFFGSDFALKAHYRDVVSHPNCLRCPQGFEDKSALREHVREVHPYIRCDHCGWSYYLDEKEQHYLNTEEHPKCTICSIGFANDRAYNEHAAFEHPESRCFKCHMQFKSTELLEQHYTDSAEHPKCPVCNIGFKDEVTCWQHKTLNEHGAESVDAASSGPSITSAALSTVSVGVSIPPPISFGSHEMSALLGSSDVLISAQARGYPSSPTIMGPSPPTIHTNISSASLGQGRTSPQFSGQEQIPNSSSPFRDNMSHAGGSVTSDQGNISVDFSFLNDSPKTAAGSIFDHSENNIQAELHSTHSYAPSQPSPTASVRSVRPSIGIMTSAVGVFQTHDDSLRWRPLPQTSPDTQDGLRGSPRLIPNGTNANATRGRLPPSQFSGSPIVGSSGLRAIWNNFPTPGPVPFDDVPSVPTPIGTGRPSSTRSYGYSMLGDSCATDATSEHGREQLYVSPSSSLFSPRTLVLPEHSGDSSAHEPLTALPPSPGLFGPRSPISDSNSIVATSLGPAAVPEDTERLQTPTAELHPADTPAAQVLSWRCRMCLKDPCIEPTTTMCGHIFCHKCIADELLKNWQCPVCKMVMLVKLKAELT